MGEYHDASGVRYYEPDNDKNTLHLATDFGISVADLMECIKNHFGDVDPNDLNLNISSMEFNTRPRNSNSYDSTYCVNYIVVEYYPKG